MSSIILDGLNHALYAQSRIMKLTPDGNFENVPADELLLIIEAINASRESLTALEEAARAALKGKLS